MASPSLSLIVLRAADLSASLAFYRALGLAFVQEQHGAGPVHFSCELGGAVLEIYPGKPGTVAPDRRGAGATLIGLRVDSLDAALGAARGAGAPVLTEPQHTPWGKRAVVEDPDGRAIELNEFP